MQPNVDGPEWTGCGHFGRTVRGTDWTARHTLSVCSTSRHRRQVHGETARAALGTQLGMAEHATIKIAQLTVAFTSSHSGGANATRAKSSQRQRSCQGESVVHGSTRDAAMSPCHLCMFFRIRRIRRTGRRTGMRVRRFATGPGALQLPWWQRI